MKINELHQLTGGLSNPDKMPCKAYSISPKRCHTGTKLREVKNSTCASCYACKGRYNFNNVQDAMERRYQALISEAWVDHMVELIGKQEKSGFFRWHDAGDIQDISHLLKICAIASRLPKIKFWLPTREAGILIKFKAKGHKYPSNLIVRLSDVFVDDKKSSARTNRIARRLGVKTSGVSVSESNCPAPDQGGVCGDCRRCWDKSVARVNYKKH